MSDNNTENGTGTATSGYVVELLNPVGDQGKTHERRLSTASTIILSDNDNDDNEFPNISLLTIQFPIGQSSLLITNEVSTTPSTPHIISFGTPTSTVPQDEKKDDEEDTNAPQAPEEPSSSSSTQDLEPATKSAAPNRNKKPVNMAALIAKGRATKNGTLVSAPSASQKRSSRLKTKNYKPIMAAEKPSLLTPLEKLKNKKEAADKAKKEKEMGELREKIGDVHKALLEDIPKEAFEGIPEGYENFDRVFKFKSVLWAAIKYADKEGRRGIVERLREMLGVTVHIDVEDGVFRVLGKDEEGKKVLMSIDELHTEDDKAAAAAAFGTDSDTDSDSEDEHDSICLCFDCEAEQALLRDAGAAN